MGFIVYILYVLAAAAVRVASALALRAGTAALAVAGMAGAVYATAKLGGEIEVSPPALRVSARFVCQNLFDIFVVSVRLY